MAAAPLRSARWGASPIDLADPLSDTRPYCRSAHLIPLSPYRFPVDTTRADSPNWIPVPEVCRSPGTEHEVRLNLTAGSDLRELISLYRSGERDRTSRTARSRHRALCSVCATFLLSAVWAGCSSSSSAPPPSIVLFVLDTVRADAVSAYGHVEGTTPTVDALASKGLLYRRARSQAPWTLPSHTSLFTGLLPSQHGVTWRNYHADDRLTTLAETLSEAGYDTFGLAENGWIRDFTNIGQGFDEFVFAPDLERPSERVAMWWNERDRSRPYFLFMNVMDAHAPYTVRKKNRFLPPGVTAEQARAVSQKLSDYMCNASASADNLEVLRGLYHGDVAAADAKLARVLDVLAEEGLRNTIIIVTADHGEHFGENGLYNHQFSVRDPLLHVPLVIHGVPGARAAEIDAPVQLVDVYASVLQWTGQPLPEGLAGRPLPTTPSEQHNHPVITEYTDMSKGRGKVVQKKVRTFRAECTDDWPVFGDMRALVQYPYKLIWYERYPAELYDLSVDSGERSDLAAMHPQIVSRMRSTLEQQLGHETMDAAKTVLEVPPEAQKILRALGYLGEDE